MLRLALILLVGSAITLEPPCRCWRGYLPQESSMGWQCLGVDTFHEMPCNVAMAPRCQCSGRGSSVLKDRTGTWCTKYVQGQEMTRWKCENAKEWEEFFDRNPDFI